MDYATEALRVRTNSKGKETFQDEDPRPSCPATDTVHLRDTASKQTAKSTCGGCCREENSHT